MKSFNFFKNKSKDIPEERLENYPEMLNCKLLFVDEPKIDADEILIELKKHFNQVENISQDKSFIFQFPEFKIELEDATIPAQCLIAVPDDNKFNIEIPDAAFQQNWNWEEAKQIAENCNYEILITDFMSRNLPYKERVNLYMTFLAVVTKITQPNAVYSFHGEKIIDPEQLIENWESGQKPILDVLCNVRLYNISDSENNELIMDSVGLHSFGLADFQIKFSEFEANDIANLLWNYVYYVFEYGDVIENGNTLEGIESGSKWKCERQIAAISPERVVINVLPN
ncbi:DUF4261 domain-containing protein [Flavobacterium sp. Root186]|uniref:DUF4261 domain-containing protein n=1 Tax=Flavobacterium sp. Root186 TaxID=1736485 RepID=UPI0006F9803B|nr:DUF4261 domain-containing protein [Flavobacterium sp. Root186]KRB57997.1 hypothetical protein ASD98_06965 [Flavobacterium sp. Root186]